MQEILFCVLLFFQFTICIMYIIAEVVCKNGQNYTPDLLKCDCGFSYKEVESNSLLQFGLLVIFFDQQNVGEEALYQF